MKDHREAAILVAADMCEEHGDERAAVLRAIATGENMHVVAEWMLRESQRKVRADRAAAKSGAHRLNGGHLDYGRPLAPDLYYERARRLAERAAAMATAEQWMHRPGSERSRELGRIIAEANDTASRDLAVSERWMTGLPWSPPDYEINPSLEVLDVDAILGGPP